MKSEEKGGHCRMALSILQKKKGLFLGNPREMSGKPILVAHAHDKVFVHFFCEPQEVAN